MIRMRRHGRSAAIDELWPVTSVFTHGAVQSSAADAQRGRLSPVIAAFCWSLVKFAAQPCAVVDPFPTHLVSGSSQRRAGPRRRLSNVVGNYV
jgi:hypothetical protein